MKKLSSSSQMFSENLKKYLKRAGIVVVSASLGIASFITISSDEATVYSDSKMMSVAEVESTSIEDTKVEYSKIEYSDLEKSIQEYEAVAQVEKESRTAEAVALADAEPTTEEVSEDTEEVTTEEVTTEEPTTEEPSTEITEEPTTEEPSTEITEEPTTEEPKKEKNTTESTAGVIFVDDDEVTAGTYLGSFVTTAYCGCSECCGKSDGITASGTKATQGRTIAAPSTFAFGTELIIDGHTYVVEDRGGSITGNRIDIYFDNHQDALNYGRRTVDVYSN